MGDSGLGEDVAVDAAECVGAETFREEAVAAEALVADCDLGCCAVGGQEGGKEIGPSWWLLD